MKWWFTRGSEPIWMVEGVEELNHKVLYNIEDTPDWKECTGNQISKSQQHLESVYNKPRDASILEANLKVQRLADKIIYIGENILWMQERARVRTSPDKVKTKKDAGICLQMNP